MKDVQFERYLERINYLLEQGYKEDEALRLVREDMNISDETWRALVKTVKEDEN